MITTLDKKTALVLIDLQKGIVKAGGEPNSVELIVANAVLLVEAFRKADLPIVFVTVNQYGAAWTKARTDNNAPQVAPPEGFAEIIPEIKTRPGDIFITKHTWGAFFETELHKALQQRGVTNIVLGGIATSIGVEGTARQASELGYNISFVADASTDRLAAAHLHSVHTIFPRIAETGTTKDIIDLLS